MEYGLNGLRSNPGKGQFFLFFTASTPALQAVQPLIQ
jgi:hypothetical protein